MLILILIVEYLAYAALSNAKQLLIRSPSFHLCFFTYIALNWFILIIDLEKKRKTLMHTKIRIMYSK